MKLVFISPLFNASENLPNLIQSFKCQTNKNWHSVIVDDMSEDNSWEVLQSLVGNDPQFTLIKNTEKKFALQNVVEQARKFQDDPETILGVVDADDELLNEDVVEAILNEYEQTPELDTLWTAHKWDINGMNISEALPEKINVYQYPWKTSHLKTWRSTLIKNINENNFKNIKGEYLRRGYDFSLYAPLLHTSRKRKYLDKVCYLYKIHSCSIPMEKRNFQEFEQIQNINFMRARGFVK